MNNQDIDLLDICLEDSLFAALYEGLCKLEKKLQTSSPADMWVKALSARHKMAQSKRPDLLLQQLFVDLEPHEAVVVEAILLYMLLNEDRSTESSPLLFKLCQMLKARDEIWNIVYAEFRESEKQNEQNGHEVRQEDYSNMEIPTKACEQEPQQDKIEYLEERKLLIDLIRMVEYAIIGAKKLLKSCRARGFEDLVAALDKDLEKLPKQKKLLETYLEKL